jgi:hypothetical protein
MRTSVPREPTENIGQQADLSPRWWCYSRAWRPPGMERAWLTLDAPSARVRLTYRGSRIEA